jgi:hypothetical protein
MPSLFAKKDPKDTKVLRWATKVKIGDDWKTVSLRLTKADWTKCEAACRC